MSTSTGLVKSSSGESMEVKGIGTVCIMCKLSNGCTSKYLINDVLYVPKLTLPLFSWRKERSKGLHLIDDGNLMKIQKGNEILLEAHFNGPLPLIPEISKNDLAFNTYEFWHEALCHPHSISLTEKLVKDSSMLPKVPSNFSCEACISSKSIHKRPKSVTHKKTEKGSYIHSDLCGPFPVPSFGNSQYYISYVDDATRYSAVRFLKYKSEAVQTTIDFIKVLEKQHNCIVKTIHTDNGGEYVNATLTTFLASKGINHHLSPPYSPESNGIAERLNRSIGEGIRAMLLPIKEKRLWAEAVQTFVYTKKSPSSRLC